VIDQEKAVSRRLLF